MTVEAYFDEVDGQFVPRELARGYWRHDMLHGRPLVGILGDELDRRHGDPGFVPARFNVDMYRTPPFGPVVVTTRLIHSGGRLRLAEAVLSIRDEAYARAQCQFLRPGETPPGVTWTPGPWQVPPPEAFAPLTEPDYRRFAEMRPIHGGLRRSEGPRKLWLREHHEIVAGRPLTPFSRLALSVDIASSWSNTSDLGPFYMNTDVVVHLHRLPRGEWLGFEVTGHEASQGIAVGHCRLHDQDGPLGFAGATALSNRKR